MMNPSYMLCKMYLIMAIFLSRYVGLIHVILFSKFIKQSGSLYSFSLCSYLDGDNPGYIGMEVVLYAYAM